jgi:hypothetical protein
MSYRNPARIVDTQSGAAWTRMQESLSKDFNKLSSDLAASYAKKKKETEDHVNSINKERNDLQTGVNLLGIQHKNTDFGNVQKAMDTYYGTLSKDTTSWDESDKNIAMNMSSTIFPTQLKEFLTEQTADGLQYTEAFEKGIGKKGGVYSGNDSETMIANGILYNLDGYEKYKGTKSVTLDPKGSSNNFGIDIQSNGTLLKRGKVIYLPNEDDNMKKMVQGAYDSLGGGSEHGEGYKGQDVVRNESGANPVKFMSVDKFEKQIEGEAAANVHAAEPSESIAYFNDITRHSMVDEKGGIPDPLEMVHVYSDPEVRKKNEKIMTQAYVKYTSKHFAQKLLNKPVDYAENKKTNTTAATSASRDRRDMINRVHKSMAVLKNNTFQGGDIRKAANDLGFAIETAEDGEILLKQGNISKGIIPAGASAEEVKIALGRASGLDLGEATEMVKKNKPNKGAPTKAFAEKWMRNNNKNGSALFTSASEKIEILNAWRNQ